MNARPHEIDAKVVDPKRAIPREKSLTSPAANLTSESLYVMNVRPEHTEEDFRSYFKDFGNVIKVIVLCYYRFPNICFCRYTLSSIR